MNTALLLQWLNLPPGPWPPEDRILLGIPAGPVDPARAETNALARMELLRPHQLKHPEVVTEGMNRLAQALIALASPPVSEAPTVALRKPARKTPPKPAPFPAVDLSPLASSPPTAAPPILEAEVPDPVAPLPRPLPVIEALPPPPPGLVELPTIPFPDDRRRAYRQLAYLRKLHRAWLKLQPVIAAPSEPLASAEMVYRALVGFAELRGLLRRGRARYRALDASGASVAALAGQAHAVLILREFLPGQRQTLAMDWATGKAALEAQSVAIRLSLRRPRSRRTFGEWVRTLGARSQRNPEWMLGALTALLFAAGAVRTLTR